MLVHLWVKPKERENLLVMVVYHLEKNLKCYGLRQLYRQFHHTRGYFFCKYLYMNNVF